MDHGHILFLMVFGEQGASAAAAEPRYKIQPTRYARLVLATIGPRASSRKRPVEDVDFNQRRLLIKHPVRHLLLLQNFLFGDILPKKSFT